MIKTPARVARRFVHVPGLSRPSLPPDVVAESGRRLGFLALLYAAVHAVYLLIPNLSKGGPEIEIASSVMIGVSLGVYLAIRFGRFTTGTLAAIGLVFEVVGAVGIEMYLLLVPQTWGDQLTVWSWGVSWTCVWIVTFPLVAPARPGPAFVATLLAASVRPVFVGILVATGGPAPNALSLVYFILPNYIAVGIAAVASRVVYHLGTAVSSARQLGSYHLVAPLGAGGMGEVWLAKHRLLARPAAAKLIRPERLGGDGGQGEALVKRFEREANATAHLTSPHTVKIYDYGVAEDGTFYYVMELLTGRDLDKVVREFGPLPAARAVHLLSQACASLAEAHAAGLVHRDIKPANLYLCRAGLEYDFVKVLDFGLVTHLAGAQRQDPALTAEGTFAGTPAFLAPEMVMGEAVDSRADLYALGAVAYWLLTGSVVFPGRSGIAMAMAHVHDVPAPPSTRTELPVPQQMDDLILRCLAKRPEERPGSAGALAEALRGVALEERWTAADAEGWWARHLPDIAIRPEA